MYYKLICILYALLCGQNFILIKSGCYTSLRLATTLRMKDLQVEFPSNGVCVRFSTGGVFIGSWGSSTDLVEAVTHQVVADRVGRLPPPWPSFSHVDTCPQSCGPK
jgi:hypothetical protein